MPRAIWSGSISFGLVNIPVKLYTAVSRKSVRFNMLDSETGTRIKQRRVNPDTGDEIPNGQIVKGYELGEGRYVTVSDEELASLDPVASRTIDLQEFVLQDEIDPVFYDSAYYLVPDPVAKKAYALLVHAMEEAGPGRGGPIRHADQAVRGRHACAGRQPHAVHHGLCRRGQRRRGHRRTR